MSKGLHVKQIVTEADAAKAALADLYDELDPIYDIEPDNGINLASIALRSCMKNAYSFEFALQQYVNKECWMDSATLREAVQGWFIRIHGFRLRPSEGCIESSLALMRKYGSRYISIGQIRYLLLKECTLLRDIKEMFYVDINNSL